MRSQQTAEREREKKQHIKTCFFFLLLSLNNIPIYKLCTPFVFKVDDGLTNIRWVLIEVRGLERRGRERERGRNIFYVVGSKFNWFLKFLDNFHGFYFLSGGIEPKAFSEGYETFISKILKLEIVSGKNNKCQLAIEHTGF